MRSGVAWAAALSLSALACSHDKAQTQPETVDLGPAALGPATGSLERATRNDFNPRLLRRFKPVRDNLNEQPPSAAQVELGRTLYFEKRLSKNGTHSCNSCHPLDR